MQKVDDRTPEQKNTHTWLVIGTDSFMSGWGGASGGTSYAAWACRPEHREPVWDWVTSREEMKRVREVSESGYGCSPWRPRGGGLAHVYVVDANHPALEGARWADLRAAAVALGTE